MSKLRADEYMAMMVDVGSVVDAHLLGRMRAGKPVFEFGRRWRVVQHRERAGKRLFELRAADDLHDDETGGPRPLMCSSCGSFRLDRVQRGDPWRCEACGSTKLLP